MKRESYVMAYAASVIAWVGSALAQGAIIHESATLGPLITQFSGNDPLLANKQYLGARLSVSKVVEIESVGGHIFAQGNLFAAIVSLSSHTALLSGAPFDMTTLATTLFTVSSPSSQDILVPLSVTLDPGDYALIFGAGLFGASDGAFGVMPTNNFDIPGSASYFFWQWVTDVPMWFEFEDLGGFRFVVTGREIPEPGTWLLAAVAAIYVGKISRRRLTSNARNSP